MRAAVAAAVVTVATLGFLAVGPRPAGADLLCLDKAGNFVPCSQVTVPSGPPPTATVAPATSGPPVTTPTPTDATNRSGASGGALDVGLPDLDHLGPGLALPIAVFDGALVAVLAFAALERRRAPR
jgi:hypothetical protein